VVVSDELVDRLSWWIVPRPGAPDVPVLVARKLRGVWAVRRNQSE
jgi:hypothetical protein